MNYGIYLAVVVGTATVSDLTSEDVKADNRLLVRILPHMDDVEEADLPLFPPFFKDRVYTGLEGELVWVLCANDFTLGYVLGPAGYNTYSTEQVFDKAGNVNLSIPTNLKKSIDDARVQKLGEGIDFTNLQVDFWSNTCMHFTCRNSGTKIFAYSNGTIYEFSRAGLLFIIGNTAFQLDATGLHLGSEVAEFSSSDIVLGDNTTGQVLVSAGVSAETATISKNVKA